MAESINPANPIATLGSSIQDELRKKQEDIQLSLSLLGRDLERLMVAIKAEQEEIQVRMDTGTGTIDQYKRDLSTLQNSHQILSKAQQQWEELSGCSLEESVKITAGNIEFTTIQLVSKLKARLGKIRPVVPSTVVGKNKYSEGATEETVTEQTAYGASLMATASSQTVKKKSTRGSKRSKKTSSSTAMKLQLKTDEAALAVNAVFDKERSERSMRVINRDAARAAEDAAEAAADAQRQREKVEKDLRRRREELADEELDRAEYMKRQKEIIRVKNEAIDTLDEDSNLVTSTCITEGTEISPEDKTRAFVNNSPFVVPDNGQQLEAIRNDLLNAPHSTPFGKTVEYNDIPDNQTGGYHFPTGVTQMPVIPTATDPTVLNNTFRNISNDMVKAPFSAQYAVGGQPPAVLLSGKIVRTRAVHSVGGVVVLARARLGRLSSLFLHRNGFPTGLAGVGHRGALPRYGGHWWYVALPFPFLRLFWGDNVRSGFFPEA